MPMARTPDIIKRAPRVGLRREAILINSEGVESPIVILDVSSGGFRLEVTETPRIAEHVTIRVDREQFPAQIRWALGDEAGGVFLSQIDWEKWS
jgi:hypothetical protein